MAKKATAKAASGKKAVAKSRAPSSAGGGKSKRSQSGSSSSSSERLDPVDSLIKLLQSPLVIDLLAVGATAALAAITEHRSSRAQGAMGNSKKALKEAGKAAANAIGRRMATEFEEIRSASKRSGEKRTTAGAEA